MLQLGGQEVQPGIISKHTLTHRTTEPNQTQNVVPPSSFRHREGAAGRSKGGVSPPGWCQSTVSPLSIAHYGHSHRSDTTRRAGRGIIAALYG